MNARSIAKADGLLGTTGFDPIPFPESGTVCGLPAALSVKLSVAAKLFPTAVGVNVTPALQVALAARVVTFVQFEIPPSVVLVVSMTYRLALVPETETARLVTDVEPLFVTSIRSSLDDVVTGMFPKDWLTGLTLICEMPVPLTEKD